MQLTPSEIIEYLFCPRFIYFMHALNIPQHEDKRYKVTKGREVHEEKAEINKEYLRKRIGVTAKELNVYMSSERLYLKGEVDEVLTLADGSMAPLDYKFAEYKEVQYKTQFYQSLCYAMLITETYGKPANKGFIVYTRSSNKLIELQFCQNDVDELNEIIKQMLLIIQKGFYPKGTASKARCLDCTYRNICA